MNFKKGTISTNLHWFNTWNQLRFYGIQVDRVKWKEWKTAAHKHKCRISRHKNWKTEKHKESDHHNHPVAFDRILCVCAFQNKAAGCFTTFKTLVGSFMQVSVHMLYEPGWCRSATSKFDPRKGSGAFGIKVTPAAVVFNFGCYTAKFWHFSMKRLIRRNDTLPGVT